MAYGLLNDYLLGQTIDAYKYFGAHKEIRDGVEGYVFRLYAPMAKDVSVIGEFNNWNPVVNKMNLIDISGTWEIFIPGVKNYQTYKFHFLRIPLLHQLLYEFPLLVLYKFLLLIFQLRNQ